jgi:hypothetical protein
VVPDAALTVSVASSESAPSLLNAVDVPVVVRAADATAASARDSSPGT